MQDGNDPNSPGLVIKPGEQPAAPAQTATKPVNEQPAVPQVSQSPSPAPDVSTGSLKASDLADAPELPSKNEQLNPGMPHVEWSASEYIANPKTTGWFMSLGFVTILATVVVYLITRDVVSSVVILVLGLMLGIFGARQPNVLNYAIDNTGIHVGNRFYEYESFKWFSVVNEHGMGYIYLMPLRRFMPPLTIHYDPSDEDRIGETLADYLPYEDHQPDVVDNITRRFRF